MTARRKMKWLLRSSVLVLTATALAACTNNQAGNKEKEQEGTTVASTYTLYAPAMTTPINLDGRITQEVMKRSGVQWESVEIGNGGDIAQQMNLKLVGGSFPDAIILPTDSVLWSRLVDEKRLLPLDDYFDRESDYPNLAKIDKRILNNWRASDGHIYFVPSNYEPSVDEPSAWQGNAQGLWVNSTLLEKAGFTAEKLQTLEGFEQFLQALKSQKDAQGRPIIPLSLGGENFSGLPVVMSMFGVRNGGNGWNVQEDGTVVPDYQMPQFKEAFRWLNKMHLQGMLDPETSFHKKDLFVEKVNNLRFGAMLFDGWDNPNLTLMQSHDIPISTPLKTLEAEGFPDNWFIPTPLPVNEGAKLAQYATFNPFGSNGTGLSADISNPDALMKAIDWMQTDEAFILMEYGTEEMGAYKMEDGVVVVNDEVFRGPEFWGGGSGGMASVTAHGFWWWKHLASVGNTHIKTLEPPWPANNAMLYKAEEINREQGTFDLIPATSRMRPIIGGAVEKYSPVQNDIRLQYYARLLLADNEQAFNNAYDQFVNEMKVRGHAEETVAEFNEQFAAYSDTPAGKITVDIKRSLPRNVYEDKPAVTGE
ncbi:extracellular solute-binding protein [Paenibacillus sp. 598K]|uniref:extracellular solute-binding protein n=1 Tax=Paenibacillus sp. 598K TaxID=1117987 RepID=UPI000FFF0021|nr:extracellular solute-binding protein [Paenibacillus sp. 598K]